MRVRNRIVDRATVRIRRRKSQIGIAGIDGNRAARGRNNGDRKRIAVRTDVVRQRINRDRHQVESRVRIIHRNRQQAVEETVVRGNDAIGGDQADLVVVRRLRIACAVIAKGINLTNHIVSGRDPGKGIISVCICGDAVQNWLADISDSVCIHILHKFNRDVGYAHLAGIVGAERIDVVPHRPAEGGIKNRSRLVLEKVVVCNGGQRGQTKWQAAVCRCAADISRQYRGHHDIFALNQIEQFIITVRIAGRRLNQNAVRRIAVAVRIRKQFQGNIGQANIPVRENTALVDVIVNITIDRSGCRGNTDGARCDRHRISENIRRIIRDRRVVRGTALPHHLHRDVIGDAGVRHQRHWTCQVRPNQRPETRTIDGNGGGYELIIGAAERVLKREVVDGRIAHVLNRDAEYHVAAHRHRLVGGTQQYLRDIQRGGINGDGHGGRIRRGDAIRRGGIRRGAGAERREGNREIRALAGRQPAQVGPGQRAGRGNVRRHTGGSETQLCLRKTIADGYARECGAAHVDDLQVVGHRLANANLSARRRDDGFVDGNTGHTGCGLDARGGAGVICRICGIGIIHRKDRTNRRDQCTATEWRRGVCGRIDAGRKDAGIGARLQKRENFQIAKAAADRGRNTLLRRRIGIAIQIRDADTDS